MASIETGTLPGIGSFRCASCDYVVVLAAEDELPPCPACDGTTFVRASLFETRRGAGQPGPDAATEAPEWLAEVRAAIATPGEYLAFDDGGEVEVVPLAEEWTRIGRSLAADIRFDDPTVSRRHALVVRQPDGVRVLDDRSLNGVFVNGERVEWSPLRDGDEIVLGCHCLRYLHVETVAASSAASDAPGEPVA
ncbi:MAG: FHA domain-containing protein [Solirubrobacteraceae bacterium]